MPIHRCLESPSVAQTLHRPSQKGHTSRHHNYRCRDIHDESNHCRRARRENACHQVMELRRARMLHGDVWARHQSTQRSTDEANERGRNRLMRKNRARVRLLELLKNLRCSRSRRCWSLFAVIHPSDRLCTSCAHHRAYFRKRSWIHLDSTHFAIHQQDDWSSASQRRHRQRPSINHRAK